MIYLPSLDFRCRLHKYARELLDKKLADKLRGYKPKFAFVVLASLNAVLKKKIGTQFIITNSEKRTED